MEIIVHSQESEGRACLLLLPAFLLPGPGSRPERCCPQTHLNAVTCPGAVSLIILDSVKLPLTVNFPNHAVLCYGLLMMFSKYLIYYYY